MIAVVVGLAAGTVLALVVALPLLRRRTRTSGEVTGPQARQLLITTPVQRHRAARLAVVYAAMSTILTLLGLFTMAAIMMVGVAIVGLQTVIGAAVRPAPDSPR